MGPETKFYQEIKRKLSDISWTRLENLSTLGTPDLLGCNSSGHFFTVELKVTKSKKIKFSPHQIAFHTRHPHNTFIMVKALVLYPRILFQYPCTVVLESWNLQPVACSLKLAT